MDKPWKKLDGETAKSWEAFTVYRDLGPGRSMAKACEELGRPPGYARWMEKWSVKYDWVARAEAFDAWEDEQRVAQRTKAREEARQIFVDAAKLLARRLVKKALGPDFNQLGDGVEYDEEHHSVTSAEVMALEKALDRAGVTVPKEVDLNVTGIEQRSALADILESLEDKTAAELAREYFAAIEGPEGAGK